MCANIFENALSLFKCLILTNAETEGQLPMFTHLLSVWGWGWSFSEYLAEIDYPVFYERWYMDYHNIY